MSHFLRLAMAVGIVLTAACSADTVFEPSQQSQATDTKVGTASDGALRVTVMTRNLYVGADVDAVIAALANTDPSDDLPALFTAIQTIQRTDTRWGRTPMCCWSVSSCS